MFKRKVAQDLQLALVEPSFAVAYWHIVQQERDYLSQWLAWPLIADGEDFFNTFIQKSLHDYADGKSMTCAIIYCDQVVGNISFNTIDHDLKKVSIGYWLSEAYKGKGMMTQCVREMINIAFNELGMEKVAISAAVENRASRAIPERLGFQLEGVITRAEKLSSGIVDHAWYGLSRSQSRA